MIDAPHAPHASFTLLLIDSRPDELQQLRERLSGAGALTAPVDILEARDVREALTIIADVGVDVVLLDLSAHGDRGPGAVRRLRNAAPGVPIVIATDAAQEPLAFQAVQAGAQDYVIKEVDDARVIWRAVRHAVERAALARRRDALLIREHDARLAADEAREDADRARAKAEAVERRARFLADAGAALSATLDARAALTTATRLMVPALAECGATFAANDEGMLELVESACGSSASCPRLMSALRSLTARDDIPSVLARAKRRGYVVLEPAAGPSTTAPSTSIAAPLEAVDTPDRPPQCIITPLRARERTLGVLALIRCGSEPGSEPVDASLVQEFAARVAVAVDNACLYEMSRRAVRTRDKVLGIVSHDLRNPLSAIGLCANALRSSQTLDEAERERLVSTIHDAVDWTQRLLGDLLDVASIERGRLSVNPRRTDPIIVLGRSLDLFEQSANGAIVQLAAGVPDSLPTILGDEQRILQVLANLISNARKFTPRGGTITLGAEVVAGAVRFVVADTGSGIAPEDRAHVFDWFWRVSHERAEAGGTGLGLAIAKGIVDAHGGRIDVDSTPGGGTTFSFTIPLARAHAAVGDVTPSAARASA